VRITLEEERPDLDFDSDELLEHLRQARRPPPDEGPVALLQTHRLPDRSRGYEAFDYLIAADDGQGDHPARPVPKATWLHLLDLATDEDAFQIGFAAARHNNLMVALKATRRAAEAGYRSAQDNLGVLLATMHPPELAEARTWFTRAAEAGHAGAQYHLGELLATMHPPELAEARTWFTRAAEAGHAGAEYSLGRLLATMPDQPQPAEAVVAIERRAVLLSAALKPPDLLSEALNHPDLTFLRNQGRDDLALRFSETLQRLDKGSRTGLALPVPDSERAMADSGGLDAIRAARGELDAVIEEIRHVPGNEDFLAVPTFDDVASVAGECPLVYVAAAEPGGLALVVRGADVAYVPLDGLTAGALRDRTTAHLEAYVGYRADPGTARARWDTSLDDVTAWLWDEVMGPILGQLGETDSLMIVAGGLLGLLPLHAAWTPDPGRVTGRRYALDTASVSYAPNARALAAARRLAADVPPARLLAVAEPSPVAAAPLPMARYEAMTAAAAFPASPATLRAGEANLLSFEREAPKASVLHLACHGFAELASPLDSGLLLAGGRITLGRLMELRLRVRLAVLSACETALPGTELPDEVVALSTGLLQAGVAGVVASQWSVPDRATAMLMAEFYRCWQREQLPPAAALRAAQRWLRDTTNEQKIHRFETALAQQEAWLLPAVAQRFLDGLYYLEPSDHSHASIHNWGAFAHVGA
jgi:CHAT domain